MSKGTHLGNTSTARYLLNIPELDFCILDALISSKMRRIGVTDMKNYYRDRELKPPTSAAFSQALSRLRQRDILKVERHECLWVEFKHPKMSKALADAFEACKLAEKTLEGEHGDL
jgi:hypothetical protein